MIHRFRNRAAALLLSLGVLTGSMSAQAPQPDRPTAGDLREEQRTIGNAYLGDAEFQIKRAKERLGGGNNRLAQQSGLWALEQIAYAKRRLEKHAVKIEAASGVFGRASEGTRKELRDSYSKVRERYVDIEERLESLADTLKKAGLPILANTLEAVRAATGDDAVKAARAGLQQAGESAQGDKVTGEGAGSVGPATAPPSPSPSGSSATLGSTGRTATVDANGVTIGSVLIPGTFDPATQTVDSPKFGRVSLKSAQVNGSGVTFLQSDKGVLVIPPGTLIPGATLNADGTVRLADGTTTSINDINVGPDGSITFGQPPRAIDPNTGLPKAGAAATHSGPVPKGVQFVDANGQPITVDGDAPPFENGKRTFVRKVYIGARDTILQREIKVDQRLTEASGATWKVNETLGETRSWSLSTEFSETDSKPGRLAGKLTVKDAGGATTFSVSSFTLQDDNGTRPSVEKSADGHSYTVAFSKSGDYSATAEGTTEWGSRFRFETTLPIGVR